ncbi:MAG: hypothetical protein R3E31_10580 [Chloroflexota bacterium]
MLDLVMVAATDNQHAGRLILLVDEVTERCILPRPHSAVLEDIIVPLDNDIAGWVVKQPFPHSRRRCPI